LCHSDLLELLYVSFFFFQSARAHRDLHSFPTRRSSDLLHAAFLTGSVKFAFQPAEEISNGAEAMITAGVLEGPTVDAAFGIHLRSEEHTSELQSRFDLVCRLLLEKKKKTNK